MSFIPKSLYRHRTEKTGLAPGTPIHIGQRKMETVKIAVINYDNAGYFEERETTDIAQLAVAKESDPITWINVAGLHQIETIEAIGQIFGIHPLLLEDILNTEQRPKIEEYDNYLYMILKLIHWREDGNKIETEQISIVLGGRFVITFQEQEEDIFDPLRQRIRSGKGRIRQFGTDYLAYSLLDTVVDHYFLILENLGEQIELVEDELLSDPNTTTLQEIHDLKREMLYLRRSVWPLREVIGGLQRGESVLFQEATLIYLRDVYEHTIQVIDTIETYRDLVSGLLDVYLSSISNKMNEVMKVLTVIATIFIPLTFITSLYGMNFRYIPELEWRWAYPLLWLVLITISGVMLAYFRKKDWL
ncbi:MAG TPA: magnesium/cobalt transporter CorA [candidate division Zixibacteria bacterium]|nr:magnesium/cobalt transporter CorA [candidate division Zixibacteria bacterium]